MSPDSVCFFGLFCPFCFLSKNQFLNQRIDFESRGRGRGGGGGGASAHQGVSGLGGVAWPYVSI